MWVINEQEVCPGKGKETEGGELGGKWALGELKSKKEEWNWGEIKKENEKELNWEEDILEGRHCE